jgi:hypothetical protein
MKMKDKTKPTKNNFKQEQFEELKRSIFIKNKILEVGVVLASIVLIIMFTLLIQLILNSDITDTDRICSIVMGGGYDCSDYTFSFWSSLGCILFVLMICGIVFGLGYMVWNCVWIRIYGVDTN